MSLKYINHRHIKKSITYQIKSLQIETLLNITSKDYLSKKKFMKRLLFIMIYSNHEQKM